MGGVGNGAAEEDWCWDLNPGATAMQGGGPRHFGGVGEDHVALAKDGTTWLWGAPFCHMA